MQVSTLGTLSYLDESKLNMYIIYIPKHCACYPTEHHA